jgi:hypothetical protein
MPKSKRTFEPSDIWSMAWICFGFGLYDGIIAAVAWIKGWDYLRTVFPISMFSLVFAGGFILPSQLIRTLSQSKGGDAGSDEENKKTDYQ